MTEDQMRRVAGVGPEWRLVWTAHYPFPDVQHLCFGPPDAAGPFEEDWVRRRYAPTGIAGVEVARCEVCRTAWVRRLEF